MTVRIAVRIASALLPIAALLCLALLLAPAPASAADPQTPTCNGNGAMWMSIAHPGLGESKNAGVGF